MTRPDRTLFWLAAASFASMASMRVCDPMLPALASDFGVTAASASGVVTLYAIGYGFAQLVHGPLGDHFGKARYIAAAALAASIASLLCAVAPGLLLLEIGRLVTGSLAAAVIPLAMAWVGDTVPYGERQASLAKFLNGMLLGLILGQALGGVLADTVGWRTAFVLLAAIFAVSGWQLRGVVRSVEAGQSGGGPAVLPTKAKQRHPSPAVRSTEAAQSTAAPADSWATAAPSADATEDHPSEPTLSATATATATPAPGSTHPPKPSGTLGRYAAVLRVPWARLILAIAAVEGMLAYGALAFIPTSMHARAGVPIWLSGLTMAAFGVGGMLYTSNAALLLRRMGETGLASVGGLLVAIGFVLVAAVPTATVGAFACAMLGLGFYMLHNTLQTHATQMSPSARGTGVALFAMSLFVGQSFGVMLAARVVAEAGFVPVFAGCAVGLLAIGTGFAWLLRRHEALAAAQP